MKPCKIFVFHALLFLLAVSVYPQNTPESGKPDYDGIARAKRINLIKSDILKDIKLLSKKDQAYFYLRLSDTLSQDESKKEAKTLFETAYKISVDPKTQYKNNAEKLSHFWNMLSSVLENDPVWTNKILSRIREIKIDESNIDVLERSNRTYILIAQQIISRKKDAQTAFDFAMLSLRGDKPAIDDRANRFYWILKFSDENLSNLYFAKALESVKAGKDRKLLNNFINYFLYGLRSDFSIKDKSFQISDSQKSEFLEILLSFIQKDVDDLTLKKTDNCGAILTGQDFLPDYKKLLPVKAQVVERAVSICQNSEIKSWKKPAFRKRPQKTTQDLLNLAKEIDDRSTQINYLIAAAHRAGTKKDFKLSIDILDKIEPESRTPLWFNIKFIAVSLFLRELLVKEDFSAINDLLKTQPQEFRPFLIIYALRQNQSVEKLNSKQKEFVMNLLKQSRTDLAKIDKSPVSPTDLLTNPANFGDITAFYVKLKAYDEAIASHTESIKVLNRYVKNLSLKFQEDTPVPRITSYSIFINSYPSSDDLYFIIPYFDRLYANLGNIENNRLRLSERMDFLRKNFQKPRNEYLIPGIPKEIKRATR